eukprot:13017062-Alexandrium_andersonii.AAC.1
MWYASQKSACSLLQGVWPGARAVECPAAAPGQAAEEGDQRQRQGVPPPEPCRANRGSPDQAGRQPAPASGQGSAPAEAARGDGQRASGPGRDGGHRGGRGCAGQVAGGARCAAGQPDRGGLRGGGTACGRGGSQAPRGGLQTQASDFPGFGQAHARCCTWPPAEVQEAARSPHHQAEG